MEALGAQQRIYAASGRCGHAAEASVGLVDACDHPEIAITLGQLGMLERSRHDQVAANRYFRRQRSMLSRLLVAEDGPDFTGPGPWTFPLCMERNRMSRLEPLLKQLLNVLQWERIVATESGH